MSKIVIELDASEMLYLKEAAAQELRQPAAQAKYILRTALLSRQNALITPPTPRQPEQAAVAGQ